MSTESNSTEFQKVTVTFPKELVERLNEIVPQRKRSRFIAEAVQEQLAILELEAALDDTEGLWKEEDYPHLKTGADIDRWIAELRGSWRPLPFENE